MARTPRHARNETRLDLPKGSRGGFPSPFATFRPSGSDRMGRFSESFARAMGTSWFLIGMTAFVTIWLGFNTLAPEELQFDPRATNFTLLTLILSLQASYAAPLILLAQNRQDDRDRVQYEHDRRADERNRADVEYLTREIAGLRLSLGEVTTRDYLRTELQRLGEELRERR